MSTALHQPWRVAEGGPRIFGHRGASSCAPENSLEAFARARADAADGVELDVRLCATGELMVFHDKDLRRLAGRADRVDTLPLARLKTLRLESGALIPTLAEVFEACGSTMFVNVEIKTDHLWRPSLHLTVAALARFVAQTVNPERVILSSFNPLAVAASRFALPHIARGLLFESGGPFWARAQRLVPALSLQAVHPQSHLVTAEAVAGWKAGGLAINVWTVDDPSRLRELAALGVDAIITNNPAAARAALTRT